MILVDNQGQLAGLVTVKDVLRFIATEHNGNPSSSWDSQADLDEMVDEARSHVSAWVQVVLSWKNRILSIFRR